MASWLCRPRELKPLDAARLLDETQERSTAPAALAAPAAGLFLEAVLYEGDAYSGPIRPVLNMD